MAVAASSRRQLIDTPTTVPLTTGPRSNTCTYLNSSLDESPVYCVSFFSCSTYFAFRMASTESILSSNHRFSSDLRGLQWHNNGSWNGLTKDLSRQPFVAKCDPTLHSSIARRHSNGTQLETRKIMFFCLQKRGRTLIPNAIAFGKLARVSLYL